MNATPQSAEDEQHLRLLSLFHYVVGGLTALFACFPLLHVAMGLAMVFSPDSFGGKSGEQPPAFFGWMFTCLGGGMFLAGLAVAICVALAGRYIRQRTRYWFVFILACFQCAIFPFGTALGVFTIIVLSRPSVKALFQPPPIRVAEPFPDY